MKVSSKGRYGIGILFQIALAGDKLLSAREIAEKQDISLKYTEQILGIFTRAGFVTSQRGSAGGYLLAKKPSEITVGEMLRATEGKFFIVDCLENPNVCNHTDLCISRTVWGNVQDAIENVVDNVSVQDIINDYNKQVKIS